MSGLASLRPSATAAVIGASGGLGRAFVQHLAGDSSIERVYAFSRTSIDGLPTNVKSAELDLNDEESIAAAAELAASEAPLDLVIVASGILHREPHVKPEKSMRELDAEVIAEVFAVNTFGPTMVAKHFLPRLRRDHKTVFAALSARVGSINDNQLGGWTSYRASKAALNMVLRTLSIEQARISPESVLVALHPGTVDTELSKPFTKRIAADLFSADDSAAKLLNVIDDVTPEDSGGFFAYDGSRIEF
jgi:NAD(P)-dependent dehydrogenase (short-subunit alcohol dehydrogenase family)